MDCNRGRSTSANAASIRRSNHFRVPGSCLLYFSAATAACATSPCNEWKYAAGSTSPVFEPGSAATHPGGYNCRVTVSYTCLTGGCAGQSFTTTGGPKGLSSRTNPNGCQVYVSAPPLPVAECGSSSCNSVGDPINPASGGVHAVESDQGDREGALTFRRFYNSAGVAGGELGSGWRHSFSRSLKPVYSGSTYRPYVSGPDNSSPYSSEATACTSGFAQIKARVATWASATPNYANGVCTLQIGATRIARLPLYYTSPPTPAPGAPVLIGYDAIRDDGQLVSFMVDSASIAAPASIAMKLEKTASSYLLTDNSNMVETYDLGGKLLSIESRASVVQTMSYDTTGRLASVVDTFGHSLVLTYDSQGRVSTVTRE